MMRPNGGTTVSSSADSRRLWAVPADQPVCLVPLAGKLNPCLRHAEQHGFVRNGLDVLRQAKAFLGESPEPHVGFRLSSEPPVERITWWSNVSREPDVPALRLQLMRCDHGTIRAPKRSGRWWVSSIASLGSAMKPDQCRRNGAECLKLAQSVANPADKMLLLHLADSWRRLAERIESESVDRNDHDN